MKRRAAAGVLALAMIMSMTGCNKVKTVTFDDLVDYCDDAGASEIYYEEIADLEVEDFEEGVYCIMYSDDLEELPPNMIAMLKLSGFDFNLDIDDIEQVVFYFRLEQNIEEVDESENYEDICMDGIFAVQITLNDTDKTEEVIDGIDDLLDKIDIDPEDLSSDEYYGNKDGGFLRLHVDIRDLCEAVRDSDFYDVATSNELSGTEDLEDLIDTMEGDLSLEVYVDNENIFVVAGVTVNEEPEMIEDICSALNIDNPNDNPTCMPVIEAVMDKLDDYASLANAYSSYSIDDYVDKVDDEGN